MWWAFIAGIAIGFIVGFVVMFFVAALVTTASNADKGYDEE